MTNYMSLMKGPDRDNEWNTLDSHVARVISPTKNEPLSLQLLLRRLFQRKIIFRKVLPDNTPFVIGVIQSNLFFLKLHF